MVRVEFFPTFSKTKIHLLLYFRCNQLIHYNMTSKYSLKMILEYIEENGTTRIKDLPSEYINYLYRTGEYNQLPFYKQRQTREEKKDRLKDWYDFSKILPYLERWAEAENTTIRQQAKEGCLLPEYNQWIKEHPEYINM